MGASNSITRGAAAASAAGNSLDPDRIKAIMARYGELLSRGDADGVLALFATDAVLRDPVTAPAHEGREAFGQFFKEALVTLPGLKMWLEGEVRVAGNIGAAAYIAEWDGDAGRQRLLTLDVMHFNEAGLVTAMDAYWGPSGIGPAPVGQPAAS